MLAIRLQRTGRTGHAQFRFIVQDSRSHPKRGKVVEYLGSYNPHDKKSIINSEKAAHYLGNGAQPSDKVTQLFKNEGIKLPAWVKVAEPKKRSIRNIEKLRKNRPADDTPAAAPEVEPTEAPVAEETVVEETAEPAQEAPAESAPSEPAEPATETELEVEQPAAEEPATSEEEATPEEAAPEAPAKEAVSDEQPTKN